MIPNIECACPICNNKTDNNFLDVKEMMLGTQDEFKYIKCKNCGCLSLLNSPKYMSKYYPSSYYSFTRESMVHEDSIFEKLKQSIRISSMKGHMGIGSFLDVLVNKITPIYYPWLKERLLPLHSKVLDVGCGNGFLIREMQQYGFTNLYGIDLFTQNNMREDNLKIYQTDIHSFEESEFDFIMYNHSFEHVKNPHLELQTIYHKLSDNGTLMIRVPVCDSYAFNHYSEHWVQLDAPRHYFLYTRKSMQVLSDMNGFDLYDYMYDSNAFQFVGSECYRQNRPLSEAQNIFTQNELKMWENKAQELNQREDGDSICFYLKKQQ